MKNYLLPKNGNFYKANLHCHTTVSDGREPPECVKEIYKSMGYQIVAFTDHEILVPHNDLTDETFLALHGLEVEVSEGEGPGAKKCHLCFISPTADVPNQPCVHREKYLIGNCKENLRFVKFDHTEPDYERTYSPECINNIVEKFKEKGFFATYNHPGWNLENYNDYVKYEGFDAVEIANGGCIAYGFDDLDLKVYQELLFAGKKLFATGADDNHNRYVRNSRRYDSGIAYTVIKAESLDYDTVFKALKNGHFYTSQGPEIYEFYVDGNKVFISCSGADRINCNYGIRKAETVVSEGDVPVYTADFNVPDNCEFFRITIIDKQGRMACTNACFVEDLK